jgi:hypothetical protein
MSERIILQRRCPRLGHEISFSYCLEENSPFPCKLIFQCWMEIFSSAGVNLPAWLEKRLGNGLWQDFLKFCREHSNSSLLEQIIKTIDKHRLYLQAEQEKNT